MTEKPRGCDIFCRVVDNYGDIGVCWRLARQLAAEHGYRPRLWVDDLASLALLCHGVDAALDGQDVAGVEVRRWAEPMPAVAADLVIEAFGCPLPEPYLAAMAARAAAGTPPRWIDLEYLSAEAWIDSHHGLASPHPRLPLVKRFFFPGFGTGTGGLLRERGLLERRRAWGGDWAELGLPASGPGELTVSLFCYENPALPALLETWRQGKERIRCLVAPGPAQHQAAAWLGAETLEVGRVERRGRLSLAALPFYDQDGYDRLLWACDANFVRGEDSFVRAQWAMRPLVWQAYPQQDRAHLAKLEAFLERYCAGLAAPVAAAYRDFSLAWNGGGRAAASADWTPPPACLPTLAEHAGRWAERLAAQEDLATRLVKFVEALI